MASATTKSKLLPFAKYINNSIDNTWLTPETYIDHIMREAAAAVAGQ